ncbi:MAG: efflux transporter outer membrane subunit [Caulobacteraceae bacterium]
MKARLAVVLCPMLLAGCLSLEPSYHRPPAPVAARVANGYGSGEPVTSPESQSWRAFFGDPRLVAVVGQALANNRDLRAAVANVEIARASYLIQRSQLLPTVNAQAGATFGQFPASAFTGSPRGGGSGATGSSAGGHVNEHQFTADIGVSAWELDLFGRIRSLSKAALDQYFGTEEARRAAQITLVGETAQAWLTVGADRSLLAAARATVADASASLSLTTALFDHGEAAQTDVDQARTLVDQAGYDVARYATQERQDKDALDLLVGASVAESLLPSGIDDEARVMGTLPTGVSSEVLLARPDVLQAEDQLKAANADIGAARAAFFPQITLTGSGGVTSNALSTLFRGASETWTFAPQVVLPIFTAGRNRAGLRQAAASRDLARANYEKAIQTAFREVADALAQRARIDIELAAQQALATDSADNVRLTTAQYRAGTVSYLNVLIAQRTLYAAEQSLASARLLAATNLVALYRALGGGLS